LCLAGTADQRVERIGILGEADLDQIVLLPPLAEKEQVIRDVAE
jgi:5,10-methylenetetrahydromethanopterin reductase